MKNVAYLEVCEQNRWGIEKNTINSAKLSRIVFKMIHRF